ncbi:MAG: ssuA, partial [Frankiales bacterium]|nr:ssuA [Frankiales bacterium]
IFDKAQNLATFSPGSDSTHLDFEASQLATFLKETGLAEETPPLDGLFDDSFVKATP